MNLKNSGQRTDFKAQTNFSHANYENFLVENLDKVIIGILCTF